METVQKVFDKVIDAGLYSEHKDVLMCHALEKAQAEFILSSPYLYLNLFTYSTSFSSKQLHKSVIAPC